MKIRRIMMIRPGKRSARMAASQPLGLLYIISKLRQEFPEKYEIKLVQQALDNLDVKQVGELVRELNPDLICLSCMSVENVAMSEVAAQCKSIKPDVPIVLGGPHGSVFWDLVLEDRNIDVVAIGEGELTFLDLVDAYENDRPLDQVKGIAFRKDGKPFKTEPREYIKDINDLPIPAWDMLDFNKYKNEPVMNSYLHSQPWAFLFTSRACPFHCTYCHNLFGKKVRLRSPENVIEELKILTDQFGVKEIHIVDDIFNLDLARAKLICDLIVEHGIKIKIAFPNGLRGDMMDRELIRKLKLAGCYCITYAVETASPRMQKRIDKNLNLQKVRQAIDWTHEEGLISQGFFMMGFPGETLDEIKQTIEFAMTAKLLRAWFFQVVLYPRMGLFELAKQSYPDYDFSKWSSFDFWYYTKVSFYSQATDIDLYHLNLRAHRRFFMRPRIILMILWRFPKNIFLIKGIIDGTWASLESVFRLETLIEYCRDLFSKRQSKLK